MKDKKAFLINITYYGFFAALIILAVKYILPVLMPFLLALILVFLVRGPADKIAQKIGVRKKPIMLILLVICYLIFFGVIFLVGGKVIAVIADLIMSLPEIYQNDIAPFLDSVLEKLGNRLSETDPFLAGEVEDGLRQFIQNTGQTLTTMSMNVLRSVSEYIAGIPSLVIRIVIMIVSSFYMASDFEKIIGAAKKYMPEKMKRISKDIKENGLNLLKVYLKSYSLLFLLTFVELTIGFLILGIPNALIVALVIAVFDILPVLGTGGVLLPWMAVMLVMGDYSMAFGILLLYIVITIVRNMAEPRIVGKQIGLHPLITLITMFLGVGLYGLPGLFLFPIAAMILANMIKNEAIPAFNVKKEKDTQKED